MRLKLRVAAALAWVFGVCPPASRVVLAQMTPCETDERDRVLVEIAPIVDPDLAAATLAHLSAELTTRRVAVCGTAPENVKRTRVLARVHITGNEATVLNVRVQGDGHHTAVERTFDLSKIPVEARALTLGLATHALLSMLWSLPPKEARAEPHPPSPRADAQSDSNAGPRPEPALPVGLTTTLRADLSDYSAGPTFYGPQLSVRRTRGRWLPAIFAGMRRATRVQATHGRVAFQDVHLGLVLAWSITHPERWLALHLYGALEGDWVSLSGEALPGATGKQGDGLAVVGVGGLEASIPFMRASRLVLRTGAGQVLRPVRATDAGESVGGVQGILLNASVGVGVPF